MNIRFDGKNWTPVKVILLLIIVSLISIFLYYSIYYKKNVLPVEQYYSNKIYNLKNSDERNRYKEISIPLTKLPYTISYWINIQPTMELEDKLAPQLLLYVGDQEGTYSLLNHSIAYDETIGGYQMLYESYMNNRYYSNIHNLSYNNRYFKVNEWVQYTITFREKSMNIYVNGKLQQIILYERTWHQITNPCKVYFYIPQYVPFSQNFQYPPKQLYSFKWYNKIISEEEIGKEYEKEWNNLETLIEEGREGIEINENC